MLKFPLPLFMFASSRATPIFAEALSPCYPQTADDPGIDRGQSREPARGLVSGGTYLLTIDGGAT
jgi:hypothetical protein